MTKKLGLRAALYARFSSDLQRSESIDAQIRAMKKYCEQNRMIIIDTYIDEAKSATSDKRPSFQRMIEDSKNHIFDVVIVHKLDRFSRNRYDSAMYKRTLKTNGVKVLSVLENLDDTPESIMLESLLEGMNEYYSKNLAREVMKGLKENALQCKHTGGQPPLGYFVNEDKKLSVDEKEAEAVRMIFDRFAKGHSYDEIISELNSKNYYTKSGNTFKRNSLYSILTNEKYSGVYVYNKSSSKDVFNRRNTHLHKDDEQIIRVPNGCPQLVDTETFHKVQERIAENKLLTGYYNAKHRYLFTGLIFCGYCGRKFNGNRRYSGRNKSLYVTYRCPNHKKLCHNTEINRYYLEDFVLDRIKTHFFYKAKVKSMYHKINTYIAKSSGALQDEILTLSEELYSVNGASANITKAIERGLYTDDMLKRLEELNAQKEMLQAEITKKTTTQNIQFTDNDIKTTLTKCKQLLRQPTNPINRAFIKKVVSKIVVYKDEVLIVLNTGLSVNDKFNTEIRASKEEIYEFGRRMKNAC